MNSNTSFRKQLNVVFWGLLLIWWGLRWSVLISLPEGSGLVGTSLLLLSANPILKSRGLPSNPNNTFFGLMILLSGGAIVVISMLHLAIELPMLEIFMIAAGVILIGYALLGSNRQPSRQM